jgi:hypothetical protein
MVSHNYKFIIIVYASKLYFDACGLAGLKQPALCCSIQLATALLKLRAIYSSLTLNLFCHLQQLRFFIE